MFLRRTVKVFYDIWIIIGISLSTLISLEIVARISFAIQDIGQKRNKSQLIGIQPIADIYRNQNWVKDYFREFNESKTVEWRSYVYWRRKAYHGKYINIDDKGIRQTWNKSSSPSTKQVKIFMFEGSTLWGTGARDEFTIP